MDFYLALLFATLAFFAGWFWGRRELRKQLMKYIVAIEAERSEGGVVDEDDSEPWDSDPDFWRNA